jgi:adenine-specific DNA-methyltransferase
MTIRRIADQQENQFLQTGVEQHRATKPAPERLLRPWSTGLSETISSKQESLLSVLAQRLGKPFFSGPGFILFNRDCREVLDVLRYAEISVDLCVTSPPYNIGKEYEDGLGTEEYVNWCSGWMKQIHQVIAPAGAFWLNLGYFEVPGRGLCVPIPYLLWDRSPFYLLQEVVWHYGAGVSGKRRLSPRNEKWLFYVRDPERYTFNLDDIRDPNVKYPDQKKNGKFRCNPLGKNPSDVWLFPKVTTGTNRSSKERTTHPAQFPLRVIERIVLASSIEGQVVLDPFAGSCSTGIAAMGLGRLFVGAEISSSYCKMAAERFDHFLKNRETADEPLLF